MSVTNVQMRPKPAGNIISSAFLGLAVMATVAAGEGLVSGSLLGIMEGAGSSDRGGSIFMNVIGGTFCAMLIGIPVGLISFAVVAILCRHLPDRALARAHRGAILGSVFGVSAGGSLAIFIALLMPEGINTISIGKLYIPGVIIGFIGGTLLGGINRACREVHEHEEPEALPPLEPLDDDGGSLLVDVTRNLDQVHIRITEVDREYGTTRTGPAHGAFDDRDLMTPKVLHRIAERHGGDEAEIGGAGGGTSRLRLELSPDLMQVDLLITEGKRLPPLTERDHLHAEDAGVEAACHADVGDGENEVIDAVDGHGISPGR